MTTPVLLPALASSGWLVLSVVSWVKATRSPEHLRADRMADAYHEAVMGWFLGVLGWFLR